MSASHDHLKVVSTLWGHENHERHTAHYEFSLLNLRQQLTVRHDTTALLNNSLVFFQGALKFRTRHDTVPKNSVWPSPCFTPPISLCSGLLNLLRQMWRGTRLLAMNGNQMKTKVTFSIYMAAKVTQVRSRYHFLDYSPISWLFQSDNSRASSSLLWNNMKHILCLQSSLFMWFFV